MQRRDVTDYESPSERAKHIDPAELQGRLLALESENTALKQKLGCYELFDAMHVLIADKRQCITISVSKVFRKLPPAIHTMLLSDQGKQCPVHGPWVGLTELIDETG